MSLVLHVSFLFTLVKVFSVLFYISREIQYWNSAGPVCPASNAIYLSHLHETTSWINIFPRGMDEGKMERTTCDRFQ